MALCKVFLHVDPKKEAPEEIRMISCNVFSSLSYSSLTVKLEEVFPAIKAKLYSVYWKDEEGDLINISSDQDLHLMLNHFGIPAAMPTKTMKLWVKAVVPEACINKPCSSVLHPLVTCDGCQASPIVGHRYKCVQCPDYDLCSVCEAKGVHPDHNVIRFSSPLIMNHRLQGFLKRRLARHLSRAEEAPCAAAGAGEEGGSTSDEERGCPFLDEKRKKHCHGKKEGRKHHDRAEKDHRGHHGGHHPVSRKLLDCLFTDVHQAAAMSANAAAAAASAVGAGAQAASNAAGQSHHLQYLRNIGQAVSNLLDPLGIVVDIDVQDRQNGTGATTTTTGAAAGGVPAASAAATSVSTSTAAPMETDRPTSAAQQVNQAASQTEANENQQPKSQNGTGAVAQQFNESVAQIIEALSRQQVAEPAEVGWTVLNPPSTTPSPRDMTPAASNVQPGAPDNVSTSAPPSAPAPPSAAFPQAFTPSPVPPPAAFPQAFTTSPAEYPDLNIQRGLEVLTSMGFSNEGGLLTQILNVNGGDIHKALDILSVIRK